MANNNFDFKQFNATTRDVAAGLKIVLAEGLLKDALWSLQRFNNPLGAELQGIVNDLQVYKAKYKAASAARAAEHPANEAQQAIDTAVHNATAAQ